MTNGLFEPQHPVDMPSEAVERTLNLARRALRAQDGAILPPGHPHPFAEGSTIEAPVASGGESIATLVVGDAADRRWSEDDRAILHDLAASLAAEVQLRGECARQREILDELPVLVFERRKTGGAEARCTFFGSTGAALRTMRELIENDAGDASLGSVHRDDREAVREAVRRSAAEESDLDLLFRVAEPEREPRWLRGQSVVRRAPDGTLAWSGFCFDATALVTRLEAEAGGAAAAAATGSAVDPAADPAAAAEDGTGGGTGEAEEEEAVRILLADDLDLNRKLICDMLSLDGYVVDSVADGAAAIEAVKAKVYDLVLMDMIMPGMDGLDATRAIRALPAPTCDVPIVALTAHSFREQLDNCLHAGMNATLTKPMSFDALSSAVSHWAKSRRQAA